MRDFFLDPWHVQPSLNQVRRDAEVRQMGPKVMGLLVCLANQPNQAVTKETLVDEVWQGAFTSDEALTTAIYELRKALDDDARCPQFVATVRGRGYRLLGEVQWLSPASHAEDPSPETELQQGRAQAISPTAASPAKPSGRLGVQAVWTPILWIGGATALVAMALMLNLSEPSSERPTDPSDSPVATAEPDTQANPYASGPRPICSVVVLPLESRTTDSDSTIFAQGLSEQLAHDLAQGGTLAVVPGYSRVVTDRLSSDLSTDAVVEGSVQRSGDRLWIRMQMVDTLGARLLWGGTYEHELGNSLGLQHELSGEITEQILLHVEPVEGCAAQGFGDTRE